MNAKRTIPFILMTILTAAGCDQSESPSGAEAQCGGGGASGKADGQHPDFAPGGACESYTLELDNCLRDGNTGPECTSMLAQECHEGGGTPYCHTIDEHGISSCFPASPAASGEVICLDRAQFTCQQSSQCYGVAPTPDASSYDGGEWGAETWQECFDAETHVFLFETEHRFSGAGSCCIGSPGIRP